MSAPLIVCTLAGTPGHNGKGGEGYTSGGAAFHARTCAEMARIIEVDEPVTKPRGPQTVEEAIAAARDKWTAKSQPVAAAAAYEAVIVDGAVLYRKVG